MNIRGARLLAIGILAVTLLNACSSNARKVQRYSDQGELMKLVIEYRKAYADAPSNVEYKSRLAQAEWRAAEFHYQRGEKLLAEDNLDDAVSEFQQGLSAMPDHEKLRQGIRVALAYIDANSYYQEGLRLGDSGKVEDAVRSFQKALLARPGHLPAKEALARFEKQIDGERSDGQLSLTSQAAITLSFRQADIRSAFEFVANSFGVDIIFDDSIKGVPVTLFAKNVSFEQALNLLLMTTKSFYKKVGPNTILISSDTREKRNQYEDLLVRTFYLNNIRAKEMAETLRGMLVIKRLVMDEQMNTLLVRDSEEVIKLAEKIINVSDRKPAEVILEVEVLEVNRSKAERLGLDLGSEIVVSVPGTISLGSSIRNQIKSRAVLTLPSATFRYFKQDVDGKTLANPKIRVLNGKSAKIHIGDRIPLRASTVTEATGQIRTVFDYKEIGIRLNVEPTINLDNSSNVKLSLEVSTLGENLGTAADPAYKIGTRNAETVMLLRDNETAILGGLIRDEDRNSKISVPLLGDIPVIGELFTSHDDSSGRTDVLLTITPRVVRGWDLAEKDIRSFSSGTEDRYLTQSLYASLGRPALLNKAQDVTPPIAPGNAPDVKAATDTSETATAGSTVPVTLPLTLAFNEELYRGSVGQELELLIQADNLNGVQSATLDIEFNPEVLSFVRATADDPKAEGVTASADAVRGILHIALDARAVPGEQGSGTVARVVMRGIKPGVANLIYQGNEFKMLAGAPMIAQSRPSSVFIK